jgi:hypothetical protein
MALVLDKVSGTYEGGRVLDGSAHIKSRPLVSHSDSVVCCALSCLSLSLSVPSALVFAGQYSEFHISRQKTSAYLLQGSKRAMLSDFCYILRMFIG